MIWCVDDDNAIRDIEVYTLESMGFKARGFSDGVTMLKALETEKPQLIILDIMLPEKDGTEILRTIKKNSEWRSIPVIMATAKGTEMDKIQNLDLGADDYLVKPFGVMEMVSRVKAVLRRCRGPEDNDVLAVGKIIMCVSRHNVSVDGEKITLTLKEFEMLRLFLENPEKVYTRGELLSIIWKSDYMGETRTVDVHIRTLRQKLKECGSMIKTVIGVGYRLEAEN